MLPSLPLRECGLKDITSMLGDDVTSSLPLRECGLKVKGWVLPRSTMRVTPLAGVWIERFGKNPNMTLRKSLPLRECGLKEQKI